MLLPIFITLMVYLNQTKKPKKERKENNMSIEIAVFIDDKEGTLPINQNGLLRIYTKIALQNQNQWIISRDIIFHGSNFLTLNDSRDSIRKMLEQLNGCKVFVARRITGIANMILNELSIHSWELEGTPLDFLDQIDAALQQEMCIEKETQRSPYILPTPNLTDVEGSYFIDLKTEMEKGAGLGDGFTSKQILLPFFSHTLFKELVVICGHIPPWFEQSLPKFKLSFHSECLTNGSIQVTIIPIE